MYSKRFKLILGILFLLATLIFCQEEDDLTYSPAFVWSVSPTIHKSYKPTLYPTESTNLPSCQPTTSTPSLIPSISPSNVPSFIPTVSPSVGPTLVPTEIPSVVPSFRQTSNPTTDQASNSMGLSSGSLTSEQELGLIGFGVTLAVLLFGCFAYRVYKMVRNNEHAPQPYIPPSKSTSTYAAPLLAESGTPKLIRLVY